MDGEHLTWPHHDRSIPTERDNVLEALGSRCPRPPTSGVKEDDPSKDPESPDGRAHKGDEDRGVAMPREEQDENGDDDRHISNLHHQNPTRRPRRLFRLPLRGPVAKNPLTHITLLPRCRRGSLDPDPTTKMEAARYTRLAGYARRFATKSLWTLPPCGSTCRASIWSLPAGSSASTAHALGNLVRLTALRAHGCTPRARAARQHQAPRGNGNSPQDVGNALAEWNESERNNQRAYGQNNQHRVTAGAL